jgi:hypothetical protein
MSKINYDGKGYYIEFLNCPPENEKKESNILPQLSGNNKS